MIKSYQTNQSDDIQTKLKWNIDTKEMRNQTQSEEQIL